MKTQNQQFEVTVAYSEGKKHSIVETWLCSSDNALKKTLAHALDTAVDGKGMPSKPDRAKLEESLGQYADREFIDGEFKRLAKAYKLYCDICDDTFREAPPGCVRGYLRSKRKIDPRTTITVELVI